MTVLGRSIVRTTGYIGAPGINVIHWVSATGTEGSYDVSLVNDWHSKLWNVVDHYLTDVPDDVTMSIDHDVIIFEDSTGQAIGSISDTLSGASAPGTSSGTNASRGDCLTLRHSTSQWVNGRRLTGRTFYGPMAASMFDTDGQVASAFTSTTPGVWADLTTGLDGLLVVWHRPTSPTASDGAYGVVNVTICNSTPGSLRSRKT
jgi:hypothetical protein